MNFKHLAAACTLLATAPAFSATLVSDTFTPQQSGWSVSAAVGADFLGRFNNTSAPAPFNVTGATLSFTAPAAGAGTVSFDLLAFNTLDDDNCCTDVLTFIGGGTAFSGYFAGYRMNAASTSSNVSFSIAMNGNVSVLGGNGQDRPQSYTVTLPVTLSAGLNSFSWTYSGLQDYGDESWGLDNVLITGPDGGTAVVPVPGAALLLATGLAGFGFAARRRKA